MIQTIFRAINHKENFGLLLKTSIKLKLMFVESLDGIYSFRGGIISDGDSPHVSSFSAFFTQSSLKLMLTFHTKQQNIVQFIVLYSHLKSIYHNKRKILHFHSMLKRSFLHKKSITFIFVGSGIVS